MFVDIVYMKTFLAISLYPNTEYLFQHFVMVPEAQICPSVNLCQMLPEVNTAANW